MGTKAEKSGHWHARCDECEVLGEWVLPTAGAIVGSLPEHGWTRVGPGEHRCPGCFVGETVD